MLYRQDINWFKQALQKEENFNNLRYIFKRERGRERRLNKKKGSGLTQFEDTSGTESVNCAKYWGLEQKAWVRSPKRISYSFSRN